jgi:dTDP-4-dehydrorhamnose 3,5-epimerase-like enzyme
MGMFQVTLVDLRPDSRTFGRKNTMYAGALKTRQFLFRRALGMAIRSSANSPRFCSIMTNRPSIEGTLSLAKN